MAEENAALPFGKHLASTDKKTRDKAVKSLAVFLSESTNDISKSDMAKLWKGIFYCFWMSDKPLVQQALASDLAEILLTIPTSKGSLSFLRGFWEAIVREWSGIDRLRIDKYYLLIRRFVNASFRMLAQNEWEDAIVTEYNAILTEQGGPLCPNDIRIPSSLTYHLADIYVDELDKASSHPSSSVLSTPLPAPLITILDPFLGVAAYTPTKTTYQRIQDALFDPLLEALSTIPESGHDDDQPARKRRKANSAYDNIPAKACATDPRKEGPLSREKLRKALLQRIFDVASQETTRDSNRRKLYAVWKDHTDENDEDDE